MEWKASENENGNENLRGGSMMSSEGCTSQWLNRNVIKWPATSFCLLAGVNR